MFLLAVTLALGVSLTAGAACPRPGEQPLLPALDGHCRTILKAQIDGHAATKSLYLKCRWRPGVAINRLRAEDRASARALAAGMQPSIDEATKAITLLESEGSAVAFVEVLQMLRDDLRGIQQRLAAGDIGIATQGSEIEVIELLKEMLRALKVR